MAAVLCAAEAAFASGPDLRSLSEDAVSKIVSAIGIDPGSVDVSALAGALLDTLDGIEAKSDEELKREISEAAGRFRLTLSEAQLDRAVSALRALKGLDSGGNIEKISKVRGFFRKVSAFLDKFSGVFDAVGQGIDAVTGFFENLTSALGSLT